MKHLLLPYAVEQLSGKVNPATVSGWVKEFGEKNDYCKLEKGKAFYVTTYDPTFIEFQGYLDTRIAKFNPRTAKPKLPEQKAEEKSSVVTSSSTEIAKLEASIKVLRHMGYIVTCKVTSPAREL